MRKLIIFLLLLANSTFLMAAPFKHVIFFGDSLSDNGNLYKTLLKIIPKSPPYYQGRFSNGPTWAERVGDYYQLHDGADYAIYAVAGATAVLHLPTSKFISPSTLEMQVYDYLLRDIFKDKKDDLFILLIGGNDYIFEHNDSEQLTSSVVNKISWAVTTLINHGAKNIVVLNMPDISHAPIAAKENLTESLRLRVKLHNQKLETLMNELTLANPTTTIILENIHDTFERFFNDPDLFNREYQMHISNVTQACWQGGFTLKSNKDLNTQSESFNTMIAESAPLAEAYRIGKLYESGVKPCEQPDNYLFWDDLHPTAVGHDLISKVVLNDLMKVFPR